MSATPIRRSAAHTRIRLVRETEPLPLPARSFGVPPWILRVLAVGAAVVLAGLGWIVLRAPRTLFPELAPVAEDAPAAAALPPLVATPAAPSSAAPAPEASAAFARGCELYRQRDQAAAAVELERAATLAPGWAEAQRAFGKLELALAPVCFGTPTVDRERLDQATAALLRANALEPAHADGAYWAGRALVLGERFAEGERLLLDSVRLDPAHGLAHKELGLLYAARGEVENARGELARAAGLRPGDDEVLFHLGLQLEADDEPAAALATYLRALELNPALIGPRSRAISLSQRMGDRAAADHQTAELERWREFGKRLRRAIDRNTEAPGEVERALDVADLYLEAGMLDSARSWCTRALKLAPGNEAAALRLRVLAQRDAGADVAEAR